MGKKRESLPDPESYLVGSAAQATVIKGVGRPDWLDDRALAAAAAVVVFVAVVVAVFGAGEIECALVGLIAIVDFSVVVAAGSVVLLAVDFVKSSCSLNSSGSVRSSGSLNSLGSCSERKLRTRFRDRRRMAC